MDVTMFFCGVWPPFCEAERGHTCSFKRLATSHRPAPLSSLTEAGQPGRPPLRRCSRRLARSRSRVSSVTRGVSRRGRGSRGERRWKTSSRGRTRRTARAASPRARTSPRRRLPPPVTQARPRNGPRCTARPWHASTACAPNANVAAFDLDDTLQKTRSVGRVRGSELDDFAFWSERVADAVRSVHACGHAVVIFSNQGGVKGALDGKRADVVRRRVDALARDLACPCTFLRHAERRREGPVWLPQTANRRVATLRDEVQRRRLDRSGDVVLRRGRRGAAWRPLRQRRGVREERRRAFLHARGVLRRARVRKRPRAEGAAERADAS